MAYPSLFLLSTISSFRLLAFIFFHITTIYIFFIRIFVTLTYSIFVSSFCQTDVLVDIRQAWLKHLSQFFASSLLWGYAYLSEYSYFSIIISSIAAYPILIRISLLLFWLPKIFGGKMQIKFKTWWQVVIKALESGVELFVYFQAIGNFYSKII